MATKITQRAVVTEDMPSGLLTLKLPPGVTLDNWVKHETMRLRGLYPNPKNPYTELGTEAAEMFRIARANRQLWNERYELLKLKLREDMEWGKKGTADGVPFIDRRIFHVDEFSTSEHDVDALYPL
jgi:hypothetical protein